MFKLATAALAALLIATPALAAENAEVMAPIHAFVDGMSAGDIAKAAGAFTASPTIVDEFAPYGWSGPTAFQSWGGDYGKDAAANGITDGKLTLGKVNRTLTDGDHAYVVAAADYSFKRKGVPEVEHATVAFVLDKTAAGWKISYWTFSY